MFVTAVLLTLTIIIPWAFINPIHWATTQMPQLGYWANVLFFVLLITNMGAKRPPRNLARLLTGFYLLIMWILAFLV
ncbi:MAG: hypothetical protein GY796_22920 [Chloroflexi bacterium]|nr:hypothetical protein [Chloroflexota bacterium]